MATEKKALFVLELTKDQLKTIKDKLNLEAEGIMFYEDQIRLAVKPSPAGGGVRFLDTNCNCK